MKRILKITAPLLSLPYDAQLSTKQYRILSAIQHITSLLRKSNSLSPENLKYCSESKNILCKIEDIHQSPVIEGYRNKLGAIVGFDEMGNLTVGHAINFSNYDKTKRKLITFSDLCDKLDKKHHIFIAKLFEKFIKEESQFPPNLKKKISLYKGIMIRSNRKNETMINVHFHARFSGTDRLLSISKELTDQFLIRLQNESINVRSLYYQQMESHFVDSYAQLPGKLIYGDKYLMEIVCGKTFYISPQSFFQVNVEVAEMIYQSTRQLVEDFKNKTGEKILLLDLCCGTGTLGIILSDIAEKVIGVDIVQSAIEDAQFNTKANNINNVEHFCKPVEEFLPEFLNSDDAKKYDNIVAVLNPSRDGLSTELCETLRSFEALKMVVYISCYIEGQSTSNICTLCSVNGNSNSDIPFKLSKIIPLDPFPHTTHVEVILQMTR